MNRIYFCIDLKTFYASVECVERGLDPFKTNLIVADPSRCSGAICLAISPKMKAQGIKNRCRVYEIPKNIKPIVAKPRMKKYIEYSVRIYQIYLEFFSREDIHVYSIDEVFIDVTSYLNLYHCTSFELAKKVMGEVYKRVGITATCGIGTNLYLAKVALDILSKHSSNNIGYLDEEQYMQKLWNHTPLTDFWQIGNGIANRLKKYHIKTMKDITLINPNLLYKEFGIKAEYLIDHAYGRESCTIEDIKNYKPKSNSISNSQILYEDYDYKHAKIVLTEMCDALIGKLVISNLSTTHVSVYIGYSKDVIPGEKFSISFKEGTSSYSVILRAVLQEYDYRINEKYKIRRIGISFNKVYKKKHEQLNLFSNPYQEDQDIVMESVMNQIKGKFGKNSILRAISYVDGATQRERNRLIGGHNAE